MNGSSSNQTYQQRQDLANTYLQGDSKKGLGTQSISYGSCKKGSYHQGEVLNCVCIDENCSQNELICSICEQEFHSGHQVIPLKVFLESLQSIEENRYQNAVNKLKQSINQSNSEAPTSSDSMNNLQTNEQQTWKDNLFKDQAIINNKSNSYNREQFNIYLAEIDRQQQVTIKYLQDYATKVQEGFSECINKINTFYKAIKSEIQRNQYLEETCFSKLLSTLTSYSQTVQKEANEMMIPFSEMKIQDIIQPSQKDSRNPRRAKLANLSKGTDQNINDVLKIIGFDQNNGFKSYYKLDLDHAVQLCESRQSKLINGKDADTVLVQLKALVGKCDFLYGEIPTLSSQISSSTNGFGISGYLKQLRFSDKLKGTSIQIKSPTVALQTQNESSGQRFCLLEPNLPHNARLRWGFKIKNLVGWIGIGVCISSAIKGFGYQFKYSKIGHGSYLLSGNGYTWSHSKAAQNSQNKSFHFVTGDTIYLEFDPIDKKLKFLKQKSNENYALEIDFVTSDEMVPCVNLCSNGDEIELILNEQELLALNF